MERKQDVEEGAGERVTARATVTLEDPVQEVYRGRTHGRTSSGRHENLVKALLKLSDVE